MEINAIGLACPKPVILAKKQLKECPDEILNIYVDNEIATQNLQKLAKHLGLNTSTIKLEEKKYLVTFIRDLKNHTQSDKSMESGGINRDQDIEFSGNGKLLEHPESRNNPVQHRTHNPQNVEKPYSKECECSDMGFDMDFDKEYVVIFSSDEMGRGDSEFSKTLLEGFVYSLTEQDHLPKYIICYNRGVFLSAANQNTIKDLKLLEEKGVEVLSCGLCLEQYKLKQTLQAGSVTNMYRICEVMSKYRNVSPC